MVQVQRHRRAIAAAILGLAALACTPAFAEDQGSKDGTDLYDHPVLAIDPGMHTAMIYSQAVDASGSFAVTGGDDRTVRVWSIADGKLLRTIWIPVGPENVGRVFAVAISPDGSTIAAAGSMERRDGPCPIYLFDRESGNLVQRVGSELPNVTKFLTFSPDGRYLAATLYGRNGLRVFDGKGEWREVFRDDAYGNSSFGAAFARDGRLATTALDGLIRVYEYDPKSANPNFRRVGEPVRAPSGHMPFRIAFSPDAKRLAIGYGDVAAVDVLDAANLNRVGEQTPADATPAPLGLATVSWSSDGRTLLSAGAVIDAQMRYLLFAWDRGGQDGERRMTYCASNTATGVDGLPGDRILVTSVLPCVGVVDVHGIPIWTAPSPILDFRGPAGVLRVSQDGQVVDFGYRGSTGPVLRFDVRSLTLLTPPNDALTFAPNSEGLRIEGKLDSPTLDGRTLPLKPYDIVRSLAIDQDTKRFVLGLTTGLVEFDNTGAQKWRWDGPGEVWAVSTSRDGRIVVAAYGDGAIRWRRADDGRELLTLQVLPNKNEPSKWDWVLWTPEGFYEATPGAESVLKWVTNHGPDKAATTLPVSAIAKLHRPNALPHVLDKLETAHALGVDDISQARFAVQAATGSAKPPGGALHVLAIGVEKFGDKAGGLHLDYAAEDAHDVASALLDSQRGSPSKASLYSDVTLTYLPNEKANNAAILDALDAMAQSMAKNEQGQDVAVILVSSHGEMIQGKFYLIPYGFDPTSPNASRLSGVSASDFAEKVAAIAAHGKVLLLLDTCHSGAVGAGGFATDPNAKVLQDAMDLENVTVLTSSRRNELSEELPEWKHGALAEAFLDALKGAPADEGVIRLSSLTDAMENEIKSLTHDRQHLGMHVNFSGDLFMASHY